MISRRGGVKWEEGKERKKKRRDGDEKAEQRAHFSPDGLQPRRQQ